VGGLKANGTVRANSSAVRLGVAYSVGTVDSAVLDDSPRGDCRSVFVTEDHGDPIDSIRSPYY
jgi:hypothetical protein